MSDWTSDSEESESEFDPVRYEYRVHSVDATYSLFKLSTTCKACRPLDQCYPITTGDIIRFAQIMKEKERRAKIKDQVPLAMTCRQLLSTRDYPLQLCIVELAQLQMERKVSTELEE
jgi:hypothetical protein